MVDIPATTQLVAEVADDDGEDGGRRRSMGTVRFLATKIGGGLVSLLLVVVLGFFLFRALPGNPVRAMIDGRQSSLAEVRRLREEWSLDKSLFGQFVDYMGDLLRGDFGTSFKYRRPVLEMIGDRIGWTVLLTGTALVLAVALGLWLGSRAAWRHGSRFDRISTGTALVLWSVPTFWLGLIMLVVFAVALDLFPTAGMTTPGGVDGFFPHILTVEKVFSWQGLGLLTYEAIQVPDYPLLQGTIIVLAAAVIVMNLLADIIYRLIDPRVKST
jgi:peptide/nickel transport system permease protein